MIRLAAPSNDSLGHLNPAATYSINYDGALRLVRDAVPGSRVSLAEDAGPDLRNYRVYFSKLAGTFPDLELRWRVRDGVSELVGAYARHGLIYDDFMSARFVRLRRIRELVSAGLVD